MEFCQVFIDIFLKLFKKDTAIINITAVSIFILKNDFDDSDLNKIKEILSNDENYYVRNV